MNFEEIHIQDLLPQRPPFVMVDRLIHFDMVNTVTCLEIRENNIFSEEGVLSPFGMLENVAQTCAVRMGYISKYVNEDNVKLGFIGAVRNFQFSRQPRINEKVETSVEIVSEVFGISLANAVMRCDEEVLLTCEMKIALSDIDSKN